MKKTILTLVLATLCLFFTVNAQDNKTINVTTKGIQIGEQVPDITITNLHNYKDKNGKPATTAKISDFKGKLLILDFWATWCTPCISNFPKLYALQNEFKEQSTILLVNAKQTKDDKVKIDGFFNQKKELYQLPYIVNDTILDSLFPHRSIPHYVWIKDNKVIAITSAEEINKDNMQIVLNGREFIPIPKREIEYNSRIPLFIDGNGGQPVNYMYRSILTGYVNGLKSSGGIIYQKDKTATRIYQTNTSILQLIKQAYPKFRQFKRNQIIFNTSDQLAFSLDSIDSHNWKKKHLFNYELSFPPLPVDSALKIMQNDMDRFFGFSYRIANLETSCLVLKSLDNLPAKKETDKSSGQTNIYGKDGSPKYLRNYPLILLVTYLNSLLKLHVIDETGITGNVNINLPADLSNETSLRASLKKYGISLDREKRQLDQLIITDNKTDSYNK